MSMMTADRQRLDRELHDALIARGSNGEWVKRVFTVGLGLAAIPRVMLSEEGEGAGGQDGHARGGGGRHQSRNDCKCSAPEGRSSVVVDPPAPASYMPVMGKVMLYHNQSRVMDREVRLSTSGRQDYVRQLVQMYRFLHHRRVLHCDVLNMFHFSYRYESQSALMTDFERFQVTEDGRRLRWQAIQLLSAIVNVCARERVGGNFPVNGCCISRWGLGERSESDHVREALELLSECKFERKFTSSVLMSPDNVRLDDIAQVYEDLMNWAADDSYHATDSKSTSHTLSGVATGTFGSTQLLRRRLRRALPLNETDDVISLTIHEKGKRWHGVAIG